MPHKAYRASPGIEEKTGAVLRAGRGAAPRHRRSEPARRTRSGVVQRKRVRCGIPQQRRLRQDVRGELSRIVRVHRIQPPVLERHREGIGRDRRIRTGRLESDNGLHGRKDRGVLRMGILQRLRRIRNGIRGDRGPRRHHKTRRDEDRPPVRHVEAAQLHGTRILFLESERRPEQSGRREPVHQHHQDSIRIQRRPAGLRRQSRHHTRGIEDFDPEPRRIQPFVQRERDDRQPRIERNALAQPRRRIRRTVRQRPHPGPRNRHRHRFVHGGHELSAAVRGIGFEQRLVRKHGPGGPFRNLRQRVRRIRTQRRIHSGRLQNCAPQRHHPRHFGRRFRQRREEHRRIDMDLRRIAVHARRLLRGDVPGQRLVRGP